MSKIILLLSIFVLIGIFASAAGQCDGNWCHPQQGYKCGCPGYECSSYMVQGTCMNTQDRVTGFGGRPLG